MDILDHFHAEFAPLADAAGLHGLSITGSYSVGIGYDYTAWAYRGNTAVTLVAYMDAHTTAELHEQLSNALLDQLAAYYWKVPQL